MCHITWHVWHCKEEGSVISYLRNDWEQPTNMVNNHMTLITRSFSLLVVAVIKCNPYLLPVAVIKHTLHLLVVAVMKYNLHLLPVPGEQGDHVLSLVGQLADPDWSWFWLSWDFWWWGKHWNVKLLYSYYFCYSCYGFCNYFCYCYSCWVSWLPPVETCH